MYSQFPTKGAYLYFPLFTLNSLELLLRVFRTSSSCALNERWNLRRSQQSPFCYWIRRGGVIENLGVEVALRICVLFTLAVHRYSQANIAHPPFWQNKSFWRWRLLKCSRKRRENKIFSESTQSSVVLRIFQCVKSCNLHAVCAFTMSTVGKRERSAKFVLHSLDVPFSCYCLLLNLRSKKSRSCLGFRLKPTCFSMVQKKASSIAPGKLCPHEASTKRAAYYLAFIDTKSYKEKTYAFLNIGTQFGFRMSSTVFSNMVPEIN